MPPPPSSVQNLKWGSLCPTSAMTSPSAFRQKRWSNNIARAVLVAPPPCDAGLFFAQGLDCGARSRDRAVPRQARKRWGGPISALRDEWGGAAICFRRPMRHDHVLSAPLCGIIINRLIICLFYGIAQNHRLNGASRNRGIPVNCSRKISSIRQP